MEPRSRPPAPSGPRDPDGSGPRGTALEVRRLAVRYGDVVAVDDVSLPVSRGETVALLGPSGCGKTTLLRAVAGLEHPAAGTVLIDRRDVSDLAPERRGVGFLFQDYALFPHKRVGENVAFGPRMHGFGREETGRTVSRALELVGLSGHAERRIDELSGGEQQRVALARALAPDPAVLLLDEPLGALDRALRERLLDDLAGLLESRTVVFVSHDQDEAFALADRVVLMRSGRTVQEGTPVDVWHRPADEFVARFLGRRNVVGAVMRADGRYELPWGVAVPLAATSDRVCVVVADDAFSLVEAQPAVGGPVGVRDVADGQTTDRRARDTAVLDGVVTRHHFRGGRAHLVVSPNVGPPVHVEARWSPSPSTGDLVRLELDPSGVDPVG